MRLLLLFSTCFSETDFQSKKLCRSEACCAASIWLGSVYTDYKVSINDISAVLDTANAIELESRMLFLITVLLNVFAYWKIVKTK